MKYKIEFELPDNDTVLQNIASEWVNWNVWGYSGHAKVKSVEPERGKGKWIVPVPRGSVISYSRAYWECNQCHKATFFGNEMNFCPNCGADMKGEKTE